MKGARYVAWDSSGRLKVVLWLKASSFLSKRGSKLGIRGPEGATNTVTELVVGSLRVLGGVQSSSHSGDKPGATANCATDVEMRQFRSTQVNGDPGTIADHLCGNEQILSLVFLELCCISDLHLVGRHSCRRAPLRRCGTVENFVSLLSSSDEDHAFGVGWPFARIERGRVEAVSKYWRTARCRGERDRQNSVLTGLMKSPYRNDRKEFCLGTKDAITLSAVEVGRPPRKFG